MHYFLLGLGILIGLYGLYRFIINARPHQILALFLAGCFLTVCAAMFYLAVTGRLPAAIGLGVALWPLLGSAWRKFKKGETMEEGDPFTRTTKGATGGPAPEDAQGPMTDKEARDVLGVSENATQDEIKAAYKKLIKKVHPDHEGSAWMTTKLNEAKARLLQKD